MNVLLLEDDRGAAAHIQHGLSGLGHLVHLATDGRAAYADLCDRDFDVAVIDRMVPGMDGLSMVRRLRADGNSTPVLILTALSMVEDRIEGLEGGADDYLAKPFAFTELVARINALARRPQKTTDIAHLRAQDIEMNLLRREVTRAGRMIDLQPREFRLLEQLLRHGDRIVTKTMLLETVWDFDFDPRTNVVETQVSRLRTKLNEGFANDAIQTVRGSGYMIRTVG
ncbi:response regulator transcription factor [Sphingomonas sp. CGMCC 1.13654]|uniref:Response regulator transcription factor n=1 Tax=Sphingomonas chungangi TaxID=2683589 RepID=A0A838L583_9SPHN|nr:response regulator transcription factor [Sphingomonas chungangi]MBA2934324.1 response regulator transcription factor [Sphingomonas chungangi]MVW57365.1 response regulator [Sphingomonas chungangi]